MPLPHSTRIDVRFADVDNFGHVNNAKYLTYIEHARMNFVDDVLGKVNWENAGFILARAEVNFLQPIKLHDKIVVETCCSRMGNKSFDLSYKIFKIESPSPALPGSNVESKVEMANAITVLVGYDYKNNKTIAILEEWKRKLTEQKNC